MKKNNKNETQTVPPPSIVWDVADKFLSPLEQSAVQHNILKGYPHQRLVLVADSHSKLLDKTLLDKTLSPDQCCASPEKKEQSISYHCVSVEEQLSKFNHFDLPFGCQQPTGTHAYILGSLLKMAFLPDTPLDTVIAFLRHLYHQYSAEVQPKLFRKSEAHYLPFYERWVKDYIWLEEFDQESWWDVSKRLSEQGCYDDAVLAQYQAMPTNADFQKILKDLCNFEKTSDGRWLSPNTTIAAQKLDRPGLGVYGAQINFETTKQKWMDQVWLQLNSNNSVVSKTKIVERFLCTLLMVYRATASADVTKHINTLSQNMYMGNPNFDVVQPSRLMEVDAYHKKIPPTTIVWDGIDIPLISWDIQKLWRSLSLATLSNKSAVVFGEGSGPGDLTCPSWYDTENIGFQRNYWVCFADTNIKMRSSFGTKEHIQSVEEILTISPKPAG